MFADMVGFTALMQEDERKAKAQRDRQRQVLNDRVTEFEGKILEYYGDGALSVFQSAVQAASCAVAIQLDLAREPRVPLRIGIHVGDIVHDQDGVYGDGVNVASRIQDLSVPGGILISGTVADEVKNHSGISTEPLGEYRLKNVQRPHAVFAITNPGIAVPSPRDLKSWPEADAKKWARRKRMRLAGLVAGIGAIAGVSYWAFSDAGGLGDDQLIGLPPVREDVVVLPFLVAGDDSLEFLSEGFQILLQGSLVSGVFQPKPYQSVTSFLDGLPEDRPTGSALGQAVARHLEADLFAMGAVLPLGDSLRVTVDLFHTDSISITVASAEAVGTWTGVNTLIHSLARQLLIERSGADPTFMGDLATDSIEALKHFIVGDRAYYAGDYSQAVEHLRRATEIDGDFSLAWFRLSQAATWSWEWTTNRVAIKKALEGMDRLSTVNLDLVHAWDDFLSPSPVGAENRYRALAQRDPSLIEAWNGLGEVMVHYNLLQGRPTDQSKGHFQRVLAIEPNYGEVRFHLLEFAARERNPEDFQSLLAGVSPESDQHLAWRAVHAFGFGTAADQIRIESELERAPEAQVVLAVSRVLSNLHDFPAAEGLAYLLTRSHRDPEWQTEIHGLIAALKFAQGQWRAAKEELHLVRQDETRKGEGWALEMEALLSTFPPLNTPQDELTALRDALEAWRWETAEPSTVQGLFLPHYQDHEALQDYALGLLNLELGTSDGYWSHLAELDRYGSHEEARKTGRVLWQSLKAREALFQRGDTLGARQQWEAVQEFPRLELIPASPFYSRALDRWLLAEVLRKQGRDLGNRDLLNQALVWYETLSDGWGEFLLAAPAHLRQGEIHAELGNRQEAIDHYERFEELWKNADEPLAKLVQRSRDARAEQEAQGGP